ncbi:hypothetical protein BAVI_19684 [Neobacillus vireti LMG 21834]|uniref:Uncharacterized protein n=2 Tax=Neobacillus TaxID=2675232 RepID=A0AB94IJ28_9BACI|nr:hypothetical protein BAVI_19684 [Neobacillus vireti LMG 21834]KLT16989.1 hypothetical protein AA980_13880 [Neobacillus vireti]
MINLTESQNNQQIPKHQQPFETLQFIPGIWVNGMSFWLQNCTEKVIYNEELVIKVKPDQVHSKIRLAHIYVSNHSEQKKEIKVLAMHHYSTIRQDNVTFISPTDKRIFHHSNNHVFLVNGQFHGEGLKEYTTIPQWYAYTDQIWSSVQRGSLKYQPLAKGPAASIFAMKVSVEPRETSRMTTWSITGTNKNELISMEEGLLKRIDTL